VGRVGNYSPLFLRYGGEEMEVNFRSHWRQLNNNPYVSSRSFLINNVHNLMTLKFNQKEAQEKKEQADRLQNYLYDLKNITKEKSSDYF
jgi:hypothetical protein